ncbi:hypothetical protein [Variovorax sp. PBL-E5]|uniref:hypothetical protein n=1 Tax=Variovorax sp. PBL-E5 TaxID=434014 RepID=UPI0013197EAD|nr:hypothetical protein [Variovorax sp. PBL-E5]VTU36975.1 hypothetical protein E5CHR_04452 [Variovorax sp. PBL-E5]
MADASSFDWKKLVGTLAPAVANAFGTPALGIGVTMLSNAIFGKPDASTDDIATAIASGQLTGEQIAAIKAADNDFQTKMKELDVDLAKLAADTDAAYLKDVQDARARQVATKDYMPQVIFFLLLGLYACEFALFYFGKMPTDEFVRALITRAFSTVEVGFTGAVAYFIGSSHGSKTSGDAVRRIAEQQPAGGR